MKIGTKLACLSLLLASAGAAPAYAQASGAPVAAGTPVVDSSGAPVGTVAAVEGDQLVIKTDKHQVKLPRTSFTAASGKLLFGMTQAQLNAEVEKALGAAQAKLAAGASVKGAKGQVIGAIEAIDAEFATIKLTSGKSIRVPRASVAADADGAVIGLSAEEAEASAAGGSTGSEPSPTN